MNFLKLISSVFLFCLLPLSAFADEEVSIIDLDSSNTNLVKVFFDKEVISNSNKLESDLKLFNDIDSIKLTRNLDNDKLLNIELSSDLEKDISYSLLSVYWAEWTIDFKISDLVNWLEVSWKPWEWIEKIIIVDSKNIEVYFSSVLESEEVDVKLLKDLNVQWLSLSEENKKELDIFLYDELNENTNYIIMLFSFSTIEWTMYNISNSIYDFQTEALVEEEIFDNPLDWLDEIIDEESKTDNVALNSAETPHTWAETWVLILATLLLSSFIYLKNRKKI